MLSGAITPEVFTAVFNCSEPIPVSLTPALTPTPVPPTPTPTWAPTPVSPTLKVVMKDEEGKIIESERGIYTVKLGEPTRVTVNFTNPRNHRIRVEWKWIAGHGRVLPINSNTNTYIATKTGGDYLVITVRDNDTGEERTQAINIIVVR